MLVNIKDMPYFIQTIGTLMWLLLFGLNVLHITQGCFDSSTLVFVQYSFNKSLRICTLNKAIPCTIANAHKTSQTTAVL